MCTAWRRGPAGGLVRPELGEQQRRAGLESRDSVDDHRQRFALDEHELGCVDRMGTGVGHDDRHRLADEPHAIPREQRPVELSVARHRPLRWQVEVGGREHADHAWCGARVGDVDREQLGVGRRRADEHRPRCAEVGCDVLDVTAPSRRDASCPRLRWTEWPRTVRVIPTSRARWRCTASSQARG